MGTHDFLVERSNLAKTSIEATTQPTLEDGQALIRVDRYTLTANNITYGVAGDMIGYWQFFPASGDLGRIPVWGIGTVVESNCADVEPGSRYYGYYPMSSFLVIEPKKVNARGLFDGAEHRAALPPTYNQYSLMTDESGYPTSLDNHQMIYRPLFTTGFVLDDFFADNDFFGAKQIVLSSASSKTAFSMAYLLKSRDDIHVIGLTSKGNAEFVKNMGLYDEVATYDDVTQMDANIATAYVDMSGNREVLSAIHNHFNSNLVNSCGVGITHYDARGGQDPKTLPGAAPSMFFAPTQIQKRNAEWGPEKFQGLLAEAWQRFIADVDQWVTIEESDDVEATYRTVLEGAAPNKAYIVVNPT
jgi:hypothetical protein